ncbi:copper chaperone PCu(A)C [Rhodococcus artemisiae]|uniref:copper chaperone PCu(A)C n=1 Tax=Rhodococcus artemisiae TaxID=714159 RepID=UPI0038B67B43
MKTFSAPLLLTAAAVLVAGCGTDSNDTAAADSLAVSSSWAKAADSGMTAAFAELENTGDEDLRIVSATSPGAGSTELHEMVAGDGGTMVMRESESGFVVEAGSVHSLAPGGDHLMLMDLTGPIVPGADVSFTLTFDDGSTKDFTAQVRDFAGAQEEYAPGHGGEEGADHSAGGGADHSAGGGADHNG